MTSAIAARDWGCNCEIGKRRIKDKKKREERREKNEKRVKDERGRGAIYRGCIRKGREKRIKAEG
jgi:hypothetical protein